MVTRILVQPDTKRDAAAAELVKMAHTWPVVTLKKAYGAFPTGSTFYAVPSSSKDEASYIANHVTCSCPDYKRATCKHIRAVILFTEQAVRPARQGYASLYNFCAESGCQDERVKYSDFCDRHALVDAY